MLVYCLIHFFQKEDLKKSAEKNAKKNVEKDSENDSIHEIAPSDAEIFLKTRKRTDGREYKTDTKKIKKKLVSFLSSQLQVSVQHI